MFQRIENRIDAIIDHVWGLSLDHRLIAIVRTMLALAVLMDVVFTPDHIFTDQYRRSAYSLFELIPYPYSNILAGIFLLWVISGYLPRISSFFLWWVCFSITGSTFYAHGGNQIAANLSLLLIPASFSLHRSHHWKQPPAEQISSYQFSKKLITILGLELCRLQVMVVYIYNAYAKMNNAYWQRGDTFNYWANDPFTGYPDQLLRVLGPLMQYHWFGSMMAWSVIALEYMFVIAAIFFNDKWKKKVLIAGIIFHFLIIIFHGLINFFIIMAAALLILLLPYAKRSTSQVTYS